MTGEYESTDSRKYRDAAYYGGQISYLESRLSHRKANCYSIGGSLSFQTLGNVDQSSVGTAQIYSEMMAKH